MSYTSEQPRGDQTRERLILAGLKVFGERGFNGTSTRVLAAEAGVNLAAIPYHFGGKQGLYLAVAEYVAGRIGEYLLPVTEEIDELLTGPVQRDAAQALLHSLIRRLTELVICNPETDAWAALIQREQTQPTAAFEVLYGGVLRRLSDAQNKLVGMLLGQPADHPKTLIQSMAMMGQIMVFRTHRAAVLRRLGREAYDAQFVDAVIETIVANLDVCLRTPAP